MVFRIGIHNDVGSRRNGIQQFIDTLIIGSDIHDEIIVIGKKEGIRLFLQKGLF